MRATWLLLPLVVLLLSCGPIFSTAGKAYTLGASHAPLTQIVEDPARATSPTTATTLLNTVYVGNLHAFLEVYPPGSDRLEALLRHEHVHAVHELSSFPFVDVWIGRYMSDRSFRWDEEKQGFAEELTYLVHRGYSVDADELATRLTQAYKGLDGPMVSHDEARAWVLSMVAVATAS